MRFQPLGLFAYAAHWKAELGRDGRTLRALHQTTPQPMDRTELERFIGPLAGVLEDLDGLGFAPDEGSDPLRSAISDTYATLRNTEIAVFAGAQEAIFCVTHALLGEQPVRSSEVQTGKAGRGEVVVITPVYAPLVGPAEELGCGVREVPMSLHEENGVRRWRFDLDAVAAAITAKTRVLAINFPNNPTGAMIAETELRALIQLCDTHGLWLLSDEVFRGLERDTHARLPAAADLYDRAISIGVLSKAYALPGIRIGWASSKNVNVLKRATEIRTHLSICGSLIDETLAAAVLPHHEAIWDRTRTLVSPHQVALGRFMQQRASTFHYVPPEAGCCAFPLLREGRAREFSASLAREHGLLVLPGDLFRSQEEGFRLGFGYRAHPSGFAALKLQSE